jgi:hypothetical protein
LKILKRGRLFGGILGATTVAVLTLATPNALANTYTYHSAQTGTHTVQGAILDTYRSLGGHKGILGYPRTDERATTHAFGRYNKFEGGAIYWSPSTGAHAVVGTIRHAYSALGTEGSFLGFPTTNQLSTPRKAGRFNAFQHGSIYWSSKTGAHSIGGAIGDRWASMGWENSRLGFPKTDEFAIPGGRAQDFQCGSIQWSPTRGTKVIGCPAAAPAPAHVSVSQQNAQKSASSYLQYSSFSRSGLIRQLEYEGYSTSDGTWAVDSLKVNWNEQAAKKAKEYLRYSSFSRSGLIDQLKYEGFTSGQAEYGVSQTGL